MKRMLVVASLLVVVGLLLVALILAPLPAATQEEDDFTFFDTVDVEVVNKTGHKLPAGYPSRRVWIDLQVVDGLGREVFRSGAMRADGSIGGYRGGSVIKRELLVWEAAALPDRSDPDGEPADLAQQSS